MKQAIAFLVFCVTLSTIEAGRNMNDAHNKDGSSRDGHPKSVDIKTTEAPHIGQSCNKIAFSVVLYRLNAHLKSQDIVLFDTVHINSGNGYNNNTGLFTVPSGEGGIYYFQIHVASVIDEEAWVTIKKRSNGNSETDVILVRAVAISVSGDSASVLVELKPGNAVMPAVTLGTNAVIKGNLQSSFLGYKLC